MAAKQTNPTQALMAALLLVAAGCNGDGPALSKSTAQPQESDFEAPQLGPIPDDAPLLGALLSETPIYKSAHKKSKQIGSLRAGDVVRRSKKSHENDQCIAGWYAIAPRGYVCTEKSATTDTKHPTLLAMGLRPQLQGPLPYTYARTTGTTALLHRHDKESVRLGGRLARSTVMAIVGSWTAPDESKEPQRLGLRSDGHFVRADDLEAAAGSSFVGMVVSDDQKLPVAYVVRRGIRAWDVDGGSAQKRDLLQYHQRLELTGRYRTIAEQRFWATSEGYWVRHKDVTVVRKRYEFPDFVTKDQKWVDISVVTGSLVAYVGQKPVYATLVSVGRDRLGDPELTASTPRGSFRVVQKLITRRQGSSPDQPLMDAPWAMLLENGTWLYSSPKHDRFGIEHTDGDIELSPKDGLYLWKWSAPVVPENWHGVHVADGDDTLIVNVRK